MNRLFLLLALIPFYVSTEDDKKESPAKDIMHIIKTEEFCGWSGYTFQKPFAHKESNNANIVINLFACKKMSDDIWISVYKTTGDKPPKYRANEYHFDLYGGYQQKISLSDPEGWFNIVQKLYIWQEKEK